MSKLVDFILTVFVISLITFCVFQIIPGDPALLMLGTEASTESLQALRETLGLNQPLGTRYVSWFTDLLHGNLGISYRYQKPVLKLVLKHLIVTMQLTLYSMIIAILVAIPMGIVAAIFYRRWPDRVVGVWTHISMAIPSFWFGILFILLFAVGFRMFATSGYVSWRVNPTACLRALTLPAISLAIPRSAIIARFTRSAILEEQRQNYVRTAKAKGLSQPLIMFRHILRNTYVSLFTIIGLHVGSLLAGAIVVEQVFALPGIGNLLLSAIAVRDLPLLQGLTFLLAMVIITINMGTDTLYQWLDPRLSGDEK